MQGVTATLDHVVVAARTLDEGRAWCREVLGLTPSAAANTTDWPRTTHCCAWARPLIVAIWRSSRPTRTPASRSFRAGSGSTR